MSVEADVQATFCATLVDEWVRAGVTDAVVCPGSRSTPLALALAARSELRLHVRLDERGAGFFAVGLGLATGRPAVLLTTSGTAAAELHPAVVEAHHARVPLLACTADRPPELHEVGAPQTIDQDRLYGRAVRWYVQPGVPAAVTAHTWRSLASRAVIEATQGPFGPGPVHLNLAFREPLVAEPGPLPEAGGGPVHRVHPPPPPSGPGAERLRSWAGRRGVVVAGRGCGPPDGLLSLVDRLGWPVLADPRSGARRTHPNVVAAADALTRVPELRQVLQPEVVVVLGEAWASKVLATFLADAAERGAEVVVVDPWWRWADPDRIASAIDPVDPGLWVAAALGQLPAPNPSVAGEWLRSWQRAEKAAQEAIDEVLAGDLAERGGALTEPVVARQLPRLLPGPATVTVVTASSMPVRDLEWFGPVLGSPPTVLANRGANGIDGVSSTAQGVAAAGRGPVVGLLGDLAFLHDVSSLVRAAGPTPATSCTLVVVDNGGGGIFNFLPQAQALASGRFEQLFGTPQAPDVAAVARGFGLETADVGTLEELDQALAATVGRHHLAVVRVRVPGRADNVALHDRIHRAVADAARSALGGA